MAYTLCYGHMNSPKYSFACKHIKSVFRKDKDKELLAIAIEACDLVASKPMGGMGFLWFTWDLIYQPNYISENIGYRSI